MNKRFKLPFLLTVAIGLGELAHPAPTAAELTLLCTPAAPVVAPGEDVVVDCTLESDEEITVLAVELFLLCELPGLPGATGTVGGVGGVDVSISTDTVHEDPPALFGPGKIVASSFNLGCRWVGAPGFFDRCGEVTLPANEPRWLTTYTYKTTPETSGTFLVELQSFNDPPDPNDLTEIKKLGEQGPVCDPSTTTFSLSFATMAAQVTIGDLPEISILSSNPPDGAIDARQTSRVNGDNPAGWDAVELTFDGPVDVLTADQLDVSQQGGTGPAPTSMNLTDIGGNTVLVELSSRIEPGAWTTITHTPSGTSTTLGYLPADVTGDATSSTVDIIAIVDFLNGIRVFPIWSTDIDRSGEANSADIIRLVDLLNGAGALDAWNNVSLP